MHVSWTDRIFAYCERANDPSFWAEPLNAISNAAFFIAAVLAAVALMHAKSGAPRRIEWLLVALTAAMGIGSFLFHTFATRWASVADTAPIGIFMLAYFGYAVRRYFGAHVVIVALALAGFITALRFAHLIPCQPELLPITAAAGSPCFNGSLGYVPALAALLSIGGALLLRQHPAGPGVMIAGLVFAVSLTFRSLDFEFCALTEVLGRPRGTHALWHILNAAVLYILLRTAIHHGRWEPTKVAEARAEHLRRGAA